MTTVDEHRYGPGPWVGEPDRLEWRYRGLPCLMVRNVEMGQWCGYVAVPPGHPWHGQEDLGELVEIHGGLTYTAGCAGNICHVPQPGEPDNVWWLGFDCGHAFDVMPFTHLLRAESAVAPLISEDAAMGFVYRGVAYVRAECERLVDQILAAQR